jgi:hypothetical protein
MDSAAFVCRGLDAGNSVASGSRKNAANQLAASPYNHMKYIALLPKIPAR